MDGEGYRPDERMHVWKIDVGSGRAKQITDGDFDTESFAVSPDGHMIAFISNRTPEPDLHLEQVDLWTVSVTGGEPRLIPTPVGEIGYPSFSPDGAFIAYTGVEGIGAWGRNERLYIVPTEGDTPRVDLTGEYDVNVSAWTLDDVVGARQMPPTWSPNGKRIYFQTAHHGNTELRSVKSDGSDMRIELAGPGAVGPYSFDARHAQVAHRLSDRSGPGQVWTRNLRTGASRKLTRLNEQWMARIQLGSVEDVWFTSADGEAEVQGWILHPPGFDPSKRYPSVLEIHGGPHLQYGNTFVHEFEVFAANGYVVFYCNPRGSQGYGQRHARAIENDWGGCDYDDVMQWAEIVAERPYIDPKRMGVTGGSYGGFMTNWIIGHTNRFAAAVTQRSVSNLISMYGSSDLNWAFQREFGDKPPWEDVDNYWRQSPMAYIGNATTPTLVIHSERDFRCDIEQGEQVYVALKRLGVDTEFVRFPEESHGLSRGGRTDRRIARLGHMLRWFDRYLLPTDESAS